jgi:dephospho-CoA kinase
MPGRRLILITGMSGAGKTTLAGMFEGEGYRVITMGNVIRDLAAERGLEPSPDVLGAIAREIRREGGDAAVAERCVEKLRKMSGEAFVVDGIRSMSEVDVFGETLDVALVAVHASPETRYGRLRGRGRTDDPGDPDAFHKRDLRELDFGMGRVIALADHMVVNEGTIGDLRQFFKGLLGRFD